MIWASKLKILMPTTKIGRWFQWWWFWWVQFCFEGGWLVGWSGLLWWTADTLNMCVLGTSSQVALQTLLCLTFQLPLYASSSSSCLFTVHIPQGRSRTCQSGGKNRAFHLLTWHHTQCFHGDAETLWNRTQRLSREHHRKHKQATDAVLSPPTPHKKKKKKEKRSLWTGGPGTGQRFSAGTESPVWGASPAQRVQYQLVRVQTNRVHSSKYDKQPDLYVECPAWSICRQLFEELVFISAT